MKFTKKHIVYFTVLAIGGGWLTMDCFSGGESTVSAADAAVVVGDGAGSAGAGPVALAADMGDEPAIAHRLDALSQSRRLASKGAEDGFALPSAFTPVAAATTPKAMPAATAANAFTANHALTSVMLGGRVANILVDGKTVMKEGDKLDGFVLSSVTKNTAVFTSSGGGRAVLSFSLAPGLATASIQGQ